MAVLTETYKERLAKSGGPWFRSCAGSTYFRFLDDGTKQVRFQAWAGAPAFIIEEAPEKVGS